MAMETAATTDADFGGPAQGPGSRPRQLWQAPIFVAGVVLLAYVLATRLTGNADSTRQFERDVQTAREILDRPDGDLEAALAASQRAVEIAPEAKRGEAMD